MKHIPAQVNINEYPPKIARFLEGTDVFDSSCSEDAKVLYIEKDGGYYLKSAEEGALVNESLMTGYMHSLGLSAEVLYHGSFGGRDYLLTRRLRGEDCTEHVYISDPVKLCDTTATLLRELHEMNGKDCPVQDRISSYADTVKNGFDGSHYEPDLFKGIWEFGSFEETKKVAERGMPLLKRDVLLHGDYCLPNIILDDWRLSGYIDVGNGGIGDRHIDVLWGIWTLNFNLGTTGYTERFIDAYGRDMVEPDMLRMVAAMEIIGG